MVEKIKAILTPRNRAIGIVCLTACFFVAVICRESALAGTALGGVLILINPGE